MKKIAVISGLFLAVLFFLLAAVIGAAQSAMANGAVTTITESWYDLLTQAKAAVKEENRIENDFDTYAAGVLLKSIELSMPGANNLETVSGLQSAFNRHFVVEEEIEETTLLEDGTEITTTETIYRFESLEEVLSKLVSSPYFFPLGFVDELRELFSQSGATSGGSSGGHFVGRYPMPLQGRLTSDYGWRTHPVTGAKDFHTGIDISGFWHDDVSAVADGVVHQVSDDQWYGNFILIRHDDGFYSFYAHLSKQLVSYGQRVTQGQVIGIEGGQPGLDPNVGLSTGHHLHFGIFTSPNRSSHLDPKKYLTK